ncbi:hypothetical protein V565_319190, partial [Rhizoctonia solani 123E]
LSRSVGLHPPAPSHPPLFRQLPPSHQPVHTQTSHEDREQETSRSALGLNGRRRQIRVPIPWHLPAPLPLPLPNPLPIADHPSIPAHNRTRPAPATSPPPPTRRLSRLRTLRSRTRISLTFPAQVPTIREREARTPGHPWSRLPPPQFPLPCSRRSYPSARLHQGHRTVFRPSPLTHAPLSVFLSLSVLPSLSLSLSQLRYFSLVVYSCPSLLSTSLPTYLV